jgi:septal ring factor EnvC (AmiA/AmiB activator)
MKKVVDTAKLLVKLADVMQNPNITNAVNAFLKDINAMTQKDLASRTQASQRAMRMFSADIKHFTSTIADSRKTVIKFTSTMKDATNALRKFDDAIINREKQRNEALKKFADMI